MRPSSTPTSVGELVATLYEEFTIIYKDQELASVATASVVNDLLRKRSKRRGHEHQRVEEYA